jgi:prepilin-type N-terminal cleavage/methylation domain-containing protein/prepilin-type processing-associated H-X9-DG protein
MPFPKKVYFHKGFTLTEIIVTVGIILTLGVVAVPAAGKVLALRGDVTCLSNLRQIGVGILNYAHDYDGILPGPLQAMQYPWWPGTGFANVNLGDPTQLASYLQPYLEVKQTRTKWNGTDVFVCPAFKKAVKTLGESPVYAINIRVPFGDELREHPPFGYPSSYFPQTFQTNVDFPPLRVALLAEIRDADGLPATSSTWLMMDADRQNERFQKENADLSSLTPHKVHGTHRNALFFDFHVARVDFAFQAQP